MAASKLPNGIPKIPGGLEFMLGKTEEPLFKWIAHNDSVQQERKRGR